jgi:XTP/dITP diphosphohydrolase
MELFVATKNRGKLKEIAALFDGVIGRLYSPDDYPGFPEIEETGATFAENAIIKARQAAIYTGKPAIGDDSGLVADALGGAPGVYSARYAGPGSNDEANNARLLMEMEKVPEGLRTAAFHCVIAFCYPDGDCRTFSGEVSGVILREPRGIHGFGYDPLFWVPEYGKTMAELSLGVKNRISHRGRALAQLHDYLKSAV